MLEMVQQLDFSQNAFGIHQVIKGFGDFLNCYLDNATAEFEEHQPDMLHEDARSTTFFPEFFSVAELRSIT